MGRVYTQLMLFIKNEAGLVTVETVVSIITGASLAIMLIAAISPQIGKAYHTAVQRISEITGSGL